MRVRTLPVALVLLLVAVALPPLGCVGFGPPSTEKAFDGRPAPAFETVTTASGAPVRAATTGTAGAPLVLFVHGSPGAWNDFAYVMATPDLAERAFLVSVDRPGWGGSGESGLVASMQAQAAALRAVLEAHPESLPAIVVGHSLGGPVAARLAMDSPALVRALVLVAGSIDPDLEETTWYQALGRAPLVRWLVPDVLARADDEIRPLRGELRAMLPLWEELRMPVVVLQGEDDGLVPAANADFAERMITNAPLEVERIPDQGHLIPWQKPERIVAALLSILDAPSPPSQSLTNR